MRESLANWNVKKVVSAIAVTLGVAASLVALFPDVFRPHTAAEAYREEAADCRVKAKEALESGKGSETVANLVNCAEKKFRAAVERGDKMSNWGLALIYSDTELRAHLDSTDPDFDLLAREYWCKARRFGVDAASIQPPFDRALKC